MHYWPQTDISVIEGLKFIQPQPAVRIPNSQCKRSNSHTENKFKARENLPLALSLDPPRFVVVAQDWLVVQPQVALVVVRQRVVPQQALVVTPDHSETELLRRRPLQRSKTLTTLLFNGISLVWVELIFERALHHTDCCKLSKNWVLLMSSSLIL